jgi:alkanesulfonate monooxygenase SsuD/methylene tetrahydromethanopterin reductase-like flavin-dependent oxidoreductase (luciferase family)
MRIGISVASTYPNDDHRYGPRTMVEQARAAHRAGLDSLTVGDHHATGPVPYIQNVPVLGRLLAEWNDRPVGCLFLVPLWPPVLMAEQIGTLAAMSSGKFIVQAGVGGGSAQFAAAGQPLSGRGDRTEEGIRIAQALLSGETASSDAFGIESARIAPLPPDGLEWWIGGGVERSIERAARLGDCWYGNADLTPATARVALDIYRDACARLDREPIRLPIRKDVYIAEAAAEAEAVGDRLVDARYRGFERWAVAYGDPPSVAEQLSVFGEIGFTDIIIRVMTAGPEETVRTVELAGEVRRLLS